MPDELRPPEGAEDGSEHWLRGMGRPYVYVWLKGAWMDGHAPISPQQAWRAGLRYHAPARPDDATERARLEGEVARLREMPSTIGAIIHAPRWAYATAKEKLDAIERVVSSNQDALRHDR